MSENNIRFDDNGNIVAKNSAYQQLPEISVTIESAKTTYVFTAEYNGTKSFPSKLLEKIKKDSELYEKAGDNIENL